MRAQVANTMAQYSPFYVPTMSSHILIYLFYVQEWVVHVWRSENNCGVSSLFPRVLGNQTQVVWFGNQLSHLGKPLRMF